MRKILKKFVIYILCAGILLMNSPLPILPIGAQKAQATTDSSATDSGDGAVDEAPDGLSTDQPVPEEENAPKPEAIIFARSVYANVINKDLPSLEDQFTLPSSPRLILTPDDKFELKTLQCLASSDIIVDFENDYTNLLTFIPAEASLPDNLKPRPANEEALVKLKLDNYVAFEQYVTLARQNWGTVNKDNISKNISILKCIDDDYAQTAAEDPEYVNALVDDAIYSLNIDVRTLKLLNYLVTPKNQGGAGHYRVRVKRITGYKSKSEKFQQSDESDATLEKLNQSNTQSYANSVDFSGKTAAEIGMSRSVSATTDQVVSDNSLGQVEDSNGDTYEAYLDNQMANSEKNISPHVEGKAVDIAEVDDIRCTLIKKRRIGGDTKTKYSERPIKLAWQTKQGYDESGGGKQLDSDLNSLFKSMAKDSLTDLLSSFDSDISGYSGDLSEADFSDIIKLIGQSLIGQVINSPDANFAGFNIEDTVQQLGAMYFADYLGLPREIFLHQKINQLEDLELIIGRSAVEQRLGLPFGTFNGSDLESNLIGIGQRKIEVEMGLQPGTLTGLIQNPLVGNGWANLSVGPIPMIVPTSFLNTPVISTTVGQAVIEQTLNLQKGSFDGKDYATLKKNVGKYKGDIIFNNPTYMDTSLHLASGTTDQLKKGTMSVTDYKRTVGEARLDDTIYGFQYLSSNDSAYNLPMSTWKGAVMGVNEDLKSIGVFTLAKTFAEDDEQRSAITQWVTENLLKTSEDSCKIPDKITQTIMVNNEPKEVEISEDKATSIGMENGDMFRIMGCSKANGQAVFERIGSKILFYAFSNQAMNPDDKIKIDLMDTNPQLYSSDPKINFYLSRGQRAQTLTKQIKDNWRDAKDFPDYDYMIGTLDNVLSVIGDPTKFNAENAKAAIRRISVEIDTLKSRLQDHAKTNQAYITKINATLYDLSELVNICSEIMSGHEIPTSEQMKVRQIPEGVFAGLSDDPNGSVSQIKQDNKTVTQVDNGGKINKMSVILLLSKKQSPKDFFISMGTMKAEMSLDLPTHTLLYYIQNFEKKGISGTDAFYEAIGQAKIEEQFGMPMYYFQGPIMKTNFDMPDFENDFVSLLDYVENDPSSPVKIFNNNQDITKLGVFASSSSKKSSFKFDLSLQPQSASVFTQSNIDQSTQFNKVDYFDKSMDKIYGLRELKKNNPFTFYILVDQAKAAWREQMAALIVMAGGNEGFESSINDVVNNIRYYKLADGLRNPEQDLLFRMGIPGDFSALTGNASGTWMEVGGRAEEIDKMFGLRLGATRSLFTQQAIPSGNGKNTLTTKEKQQLSAKMGITSAAIDKFMQALNGEIDPHELETENLDASYMALNPYVEQTDSTDGTVCPDYFKMTDGYSIASNMLVNRSYVYVDKDGTHSFMSKDEADSYANAHGDKKIDTLTEIAYGLTKVFGTSTGWEEQSVEIQKTNLRHLLYDKKPVSFTSDDSARTEFEKQNGFSIDLVERMLNPQKAFLVNDPLRAYKKQVGQMEAKRILSWKLLRAFGVDVDPSLFSGDDLFGILNGDIDSLYKIGGAVVDDRFDLPRGATYDILMAKTPKLRECAITQAGGQMLGGLVGLNYINLKGNIIQNMGEAKIEETLGFPRNTFKGDSLDALAKKYPIAFALGFQIPLDGIAMDRAIYQIYQGEMADAINKLSGQAKLEKIHDYLIANPYISTGLFSAMATLNTAIYNRIKDTLDPSKPYWSTGYKVSGDSDYKTELRKFLTNMTYLDSSFGLAPGTTQKFLTQKSTTVCNAVVVTDDFTHQQSEVQKCVEKVITPDAYSGMVSDGALKQMAILKALDLFGIEGYKAEAVMDLVKNFRVWTANKQYGDIYSALAKYFNITWDVKAGFTEGTIESVLNNPSKGPVILLAEAIKDFDAKFGLDSGGDKSFSHVFELYQERNDTCKGTYIETPREDSLRTESGILAWKVLHYPYTTEDERSADLQQLNNIANEQIQANQNYQWCKEQSRNNLGAQAWQMMQYALAAKVSDKIFEASGNTLRMPADDILQLVQKGDMRYLEAATISYGLNRYLDKDEEMATLPQGFRLSYDDIKLMLFGDITAETYAVDAVTYSVLHPSDSTYEASNASYLYHDICPDGKGNGILDCTLSQDLWNGSADYNRDYGSLVGANNKIFQAKYGMPPEKQAETEKEFQDLTNYVRACGSNFSASETERTLCSMRTKKWHDIIERREQEAPKNQSRSIFSDMVRFRLMDTALWKFDHNVFPGFSYALMKGDARSKNYAIAHYIENGIINGEFFNEKVPWLQGLGDAAGVASVASYAYALSQGTDRKVAFDKLADGNGAGFNYLTSYISTNSEKWFNFEIDPELAGGLVLGISTGEWGFENGLQAYDHKYATAGGRTITTLGGYGVKWGLNKVFSWADDQLGLKPGTSQEVFNMGVQVYNVTQVSHQILQMGNMIGDYQAQGAVINGLTEVPDSGGLFFKDLPEVDQNELRSAYNDAGSQIKEYGAAHPEAQGKILEQTNGRLNDGKAAAQQVKITDPLDGQVQQADAEKAKGVNSDFKAQLVITLVSQWISNYLAKVFGDQISKIEEQLGLVPGSTMILVTGAISLELSVIAHANKLLSQAGMNAAMTAFWAAVILFVLVNLFGVYKIELLCSADGYYPAIEAPPSPNVADVSGIGIWDGKNKAMAEQKSIQAAQYKARTLAGDAIMMQENPEFKDIIPSQIMTGRQEDVDYWNSAVSNELCSKMGLTAIGGVCGGDTQAGMWQNPQTVAYTHIGF